MHGNAYYVITLLIGLFVFFQISQYYSYEDSINKQKQIFEKYEALKSTIEDSCKKNEKFKGDINNYESKLEEFQSNQQTLKIAFNKQLDILDEMKINYYKHNTIILDMITNKLTSDFYGTLPFDDLYNLFSIFPDDGFLEKSSYKINYEFLFKHLNDHFSEYVFFTHHKTSLHFQAVIKNIIDKNNVPDLIITLLNELLSKLKELDERN